MSMCVRRNKGGERKPRIFQNFSAKQYCKAAILISVLAEKYTSILSLWHITYYVDKQYGLLVAYYDIRTSPKILQRNKK